MSEWIEVIVEVDGRLEPGDVWPDGVPESWDAAAVAAEISKCGQPAELLSDWCLPCSVRVVVTRRNPHWRGPDALLEPPPEFLRTEAEVTWW